MVGRLILILGMILGLGGLLVAQAPVPTRAQLFAGSWRLLPELSGVHPRLFTTAATLAATTQRNQIDPTVLQKYLPNPAKPHGTPPTRLQDKENAFLAQNIAHLAAAYRLTKRPEYAAALREWLPFLRQFEPIKIDRRSPSTANRDLSVGEALLGLANTYDLLAGVWPADELAVFRTALVNQAKQAYADFTQLGSYHYEQNHLIIPVCGLGIAAVALGDEVSEAQAWGVFARNLIGRSLAAVAPDGWFFEGLSYWSFTMEFPVTYAVAWKRGTGEDLLAKAPFNQVADYLLHNFLPNPNYVFDFADWGPRVNDDATAQRGYDQAWHTVPTRIFSLIPYLINREHPDPRLAAFLNWTAPLNTGLGALDKTMLGLDGWAWPVSNQGLRLPGDEPPFHYFWDMDAIHWRSSWTDPGATALAFKAGPPAGHAIAKLYPLYPEWKAGLGHVHPDAGSFIIFAKNAFLANSTGYTVKYSKWQNTLTVDGRGQGDEGTAWDTYAKVPYERLDKVHLEAVWLDEAVAAGTAVLQDAYDPKLGLTKLERQLIMVDGRFMVLADQMTATKPHVYDWFLHTDQAPQALGPTSWQMTNGQARLVVGALKNIAASEIAPTIVETQVYPGPSRPQQRGFHLNLRSESGTSQQFLTGLVIQDAKTDPKVVRMKQLGPGLVELIDGDTTCRIWLGKQTDLDGSYGFVMSQKGKPVLLGLKGNRLQFEGGALELPDGGQVLLRPTAQGWKESYHSATLWRLR